MNTKNPIRVTLPKGKGAGTEIQSYFEPYFKTKTEEEEEKSDLPRHSIGAQFTAAATLEPADG